MYEIILVMFNDLLFWVTAEVVIVPEETKVVEFDSGQLNILISRYSYTLKVF
jgi:hypothetical protein